MPKKLTQMPLCDYGASCNRKNCIYRHPVKKPEKICPPVQTSAAAMVAEAEARCMATAEAFERIITYHRGGSGAQPEVGVKMVRNALKEVTLTLT